MKNNYQSQDNCARCNEYIYGNPEQDAQCLAIRMKDISIVLCGNCSKKLLDFKAEKDYEILCEFLNMRQNDQEKINGMD